MIDTRRRASADEEAPGRRVGWRPIRKHAGPVRVRGAFRPSARRASHTANATGAVSRPKQIGHFARHFGEMCVPMCIGFAVGDLVYFSIAGLFGYSNPFSQLPVLSVLVVTFSMTAPMTAWMRFRGMPPRAIAEMSAAMPILAVVLLALGWLGILPMSSLALTEHGLMMPVMLIPMMLRLDFYTGRSGLRYSPQVVRGDPS